jgi:hypothetical protein
MYLVQILLPLYDNDKNSLDASRKRPGEDKSRRNGLETAARRFQRLTI